MPEFTANPDPLLAQRRDEMLNLLLGKMRARRRVRRVGAGAALLAAGATVALFARVPAETARPVEVAVAPAPVTHVGAESQATPPLPRAIKTVAISTDVDVLKRTAVTPGAIRIEFLDDATLVASLEPTCGQVGLSRMGHDVRVLGGCPEIYASAAKR